MGRFKQKMPCYTGSLVDLEYIVYNFLKTCQSTSGKGYIMAVFFGLSLYCLYGWVANVRAREAFPMVLGLLKSVF